MSVEQEILVTGIKVVDLLAPYAKGGKIGWFITSCCPLMYIYIYKTQLLLPRYLTSVYYVFKVSLVVQVWERLC